eukprot:9638230-Prorocentrum_lima.AAC.1
MSTTLRVFHTSAAADFKGKGIYPINGCGWWLSPADSRELAPTEGFRSNTKRNVHRYCAGCSERYSQDLHLANRL